MDDGRGSIRVMDSTLVDARNPVSLSPHPAEKSRTFLGVNVSQKYLLTLALKCVRVSRDELVLTTSYSNSHGFIVLRVQRINLPSAPFKNFGSAFLLFIISFAELSQIVLVFDLLFQ